MITHDLLVTRNDEGWFWKWSIAKDDFRRDVAWSVTPLLSYVEAVYAANVYCPRDDNKDYSLELRSNHE